MSHSDQTPSVPDTSCLDEFLSHLSPPKVLDVGCGDGVFTRRLADSLCSFQEILGIDPDKDSIDEARELTEHQKVRYRLLADRELQHSDARFDLVTISNALHHLSHPIASIGRIARYVRPGGHLLIREMVSDTLSTPEQNSREIHHVKAEVDRACGRVHNGTYTAEQIRRILHEGTGGWSIEFSCEEHSDVESHSESLAYVREYLSHLTDPGLAGELSRRLDAVAASIASVGVATPRRLILASRRPEATE